MADKALQTHIDSLTATLDKMLPKALSKSGRTSVHSLHGKIGSKNNEYVDAVRESFLSPQQFIDGWKAGALNRAKEQDDKDIKWDGKPHQRSSAHEIVEMCQDPFLLLYIELFLERNFYRQYEERVRKKPEDKLWELWFGGKNDEWGLFITPRFENGVWENDVSHIRRAKFDYWTIGHALTSGFIAPNDPVIHEVPNLKQLFSLYHKSFIRATASTHSVAFGKEYEAFVKSQKDPLAVPFLIPEFRFEGIATNHKYRLDFTILSASQGRKIGIELSPWSTHGHVAGKKELVKTGGPGAIEKTQMAKWEADIAKRNAYFLTFGITTLTFTDSHLKNPTDTFAKVIPYLTPAPSAATATPQVAQGVATYKILPANKKLK